MMNGFAEIVRLGGIMSSADYPTPPGVGKCRFDKSKIAAYINGSITLSKDEDFLTKWLAVVGPIAIGLNANNMQFYNGGIAHPSKNLCDPLELDHNALIVGFGTEGKVNFWIIKNSWGADWGENGYYRVYRGGGVCGINQEACTAEVE